MRHLIRIPHIITLALAVTVNAPALAGDCRTLRPQYEGRKFFLQHNLHIGDNEANWVNFIAAGDFIPLGTSAQVVKMKADVVVLIVEGRENRLTFDLEDAQPNCSVILERVLGPNTPQLSGMSETDLEGIKRGAILLGMSRRAVFLAVGYPPYYYSPPFFLNKKGAINHDPSASELTFMGSTWDFIRVRFSNDIVVSVED